MLAHPGPKRGMKKLSGGIRGAVKHKLRAKRINYSKLFIRNFGRVPYFDVELGRTADLRPCLDPRLRKPGISGFMRLKNEAQFVETAIESVIGCLDELVIVHNGCTDRTPEIIESCRLRHPDRIRIFEYEPEVFPPGSPEHLREPMGSPNSLINYYNFALVKTTRKVAIKIDGDELYLERPFRQLTDSIRSGHYPIPVGISGLNLWDEKGAIHVNASRPITSGLDAGFFTVNPRTFFVHFRRYELFTYAFERTAGVFYYHLKGMKKDRGLGNYDFQSGATTFSPAKVARLKAPQLMTWQQFMLQMDDPTLFPEPSALGLRARQNPT